MATKRKGEPVTSDVRMSALWGSSSKRLGRR